MPRPAPQSIFDLPSVNGSLDGAQLDHPEDVYRATDPKTVENKAPHYSPYYDVSDPSSQSHHTRDTDTSSIFTQATIDHSTMNQQPDRKRRFSFRLKIKSSATGEEAKGLLADPKEQSKSNKGRFNIFNSKPYEPTEKDLEVAQRIRERLGSREEAVRRGAAQPAGIKGSHGAYLGGSPS